LREISQAIQFYFEVLKMSRDSYSICVDCKSFQDNGVVVNATCADRHDTLESFDAEMKKNNWPVDGGNASNRLIKAFLQRHKGHTVEYWSTDWYYDQDDPLEGLKEEK